MTRRAAFTAARPADLGARCWRTRHMGESRPWRSTMCLVVALVFWILGDTAERYFCPVVRTLADRWNLAPATAGVTLLALGNGAPDVFASLAAFTRASRVLDDETSETSAAAAAGATAAAGAIVSAGMFVSGAVVGAVALVAAPFPVDPRPFRRDVSCYLAAVIVTAVVVADGKVHAWEAAALPAYYVAFVGYVVWCDARTDPGAKERSRRGASTWRPGGRRRRRRRRRRRGKDRMTTSARSRPATSPPRRHSRYERRRPRVDSSTAPAAGSRRDGGKGKAAVLVLVFVSAVIRRFAARSMRRRWCVSSRPSRLRAARRPSHAGIPNGGTGFTRAPTLRCRRFC